MLRTGGRATIMVYYRGIWNYYVMGGFFRGVLQGELFRTKSMHKTIQSRTDGAIARYYSFPDWMILASPPFRIISMRVLGTKTDLLPLPASSLKDAVSLLLPMGIARVLTSRFRMGSFLVSTLEK